MTQGNDKLLIESGIGETRVARVGDEGPILFKTYQEEGGSKVGNLYVARVKTIMGEANAAVLDLGPDGDALLPFNKARALAPQKGAKSIRHCVVEGAFHLVEIIRDRDVEDDKLAVASARAGLHGRYVRVEANGTGHGFIQKHKDKEWMEELSAIAEAFASKMNISIKPAAFEADEEMFVAELESLATALLDLQQDMSKPGLAVEQASVGERILTELANSGIAKVIYDDAAMFAEAQELAQNYWPDLLPLLQKANAKSNLMDDHNVTPMLETVLEGTMAVGNGGYITIEHTKAATMIDINTGRAGKGKTPQKVQEEINIQAAKAIMRLIRFQNIGGIIIIDFINNLNGGAISRLLKSVDRGIKQDHAQVERTGLSRFGIMQLQRQKKGPSLYETMMAKGQDHQQESFLAYQALRIAKRVGLGGGAGNLLITAPKSTIQWLEERPGLLTNLSERTSRTISFDESKGSGVEALSVRLKK